MISYTDRIGGSENSQKLFRLVNYYTFSNGSKWPSSLVSWGLFTSPMGDERWEHRWLFCTDLAGQDLADTYWQMMTHEDLFSRNVFQELYQRPPTRYWFRGWVYINICKYPNSSHHINLWTKSPKRDIYHTLLMGQKPEPVDGSTWGFFILWARWSITEPTVGTCSGTRIWSC